MENIIGEGLMKIMKDIEINAPIEFTYNTYADILRWKDVLKDVRDVSVYYDDGFHQEFDMTVKRDDKEETVHSVRFCYPLHSIEIFQTKPPPHLSRMSGTWNFSAHSTGTHVQASREFEIKQGSHFDISILEKFLEINLKSFKDWIETNA